MYTIEANQNLAFEVEFEVDDKQLAEQALATLNSKVLEGDIFTLQHYHRDEKYYKTLFYVKVTIENCTPMCNMVKDELQLWGK